MKTELELQIEDLKTVFNSMKLTLVYPSPESSTGLHYFGSIKSEIFDIPMIRIELFENNGLVIVSFGNRFDPEESHYITNYNGDLIGEFFKILDKQIEGDELKKN